MPSLLIVWEEYHLLDYMPVSVKKFTLTAMMHGWPYDGAGQLCLASSHSFLKISILGFQNQLHLIVADLIDVANL